MKTKLIVLFLAIVANVSMFAQSIWFEQDVRLLDKESALFYTQIQYTQNIGETGLSIAPYLATSYDWHEGLAFLNYTKGIFSGGIGAGVESNKTFNQLGFRWSPWIRIAPVLYKGEDGILEILSQWEFGKGTGNYWYSNSISYKGGSERNVKGELGLLARRFYGIGPIIGMTFIIKDQSSLRLALAPLYDIEAKKGKPTMFVTITL